MATPDNAQQAVLAGQEYFRLKRVVQSPGDIYELNESTRAIYIGPDSDIAEARVTYYNPSQPLGLETADVSVNGPFIGRVDALLATVVPSTSQQARILVSPVDIVNNAYVRPAAIAPQRSFNVPAIIDLILALKTLPSIPAVRADRTFRFPNVPYDTDAGILAHSTDLIIPIYGRRMITCQFIGPLGHGYYADFFLVALQPGQSPNPKSLGGITQAGLSVPTTNTVVVKASDSIARNQVSGNIFNTVPALVNTYTENNGPPLPAVKGFADLLVINIGRFGGLAVAGTAFIDCFIKLTDRET